VTIREVEIQEQLETLYALLKVFDEPLPADVPFAYAVEEFKLWERLREQIRALERELAELNTKAEGTATKDARSSKTIAYYIALTDKLLKNKRLARKLSGS
jgi:hypothetical protein